MNETLQLQHQRIQRIDRKRGIDEMQRLIETALKKRHPCHGAQGACILRMVLMCLRKFCVGGLEVKSVYGVSYRQCNVRRGGMGIEDRCAISCLLDPLPSYLAGYQVLGYLPYKRDGKFISGRGEGGVELQRPLEVHLRFPNSGLVIAIHGESTAQVQSIRFSAAELALRSQFIPANRHLQRAGDSGCNVVLQSQHVTEIAVVGA